MGEVSGCGIVDICGPLCESVVWELAVAPNLGEHEEAKSEGEEVGGSEKMNPLSSLEFCLLLLPSRKVIFGTEGEVSTRGRLPSQHVNEAIM